MEPPSPHSIRILDRIESGLPHRRIVEAVSLALSGEGARDVEVLLTNDEEIQSLNRGSRGVDEPTDVLTFPAPRFPGAPLGEIVVSIELAARQAKLRGFSLLDEVCYLAIHGALHLRGLDDETDDERQTMFAEMHRLGLALGLPEETQWTSVALHTEAAKR